MLRAVRRLLVSILLVALFVGASSGPLAQASSFKRCGSAGTVKSARVTLVNVRAKGISCRRGRQFARAFTRKSGPETSFACAESLHCIWRGWSCLNDARSGDLRHRCRKSTSSGQRIMVVKWKPRAGVHSSGEQMAMRRRCGLLEGARIFAFNLSCRRANRLSRGPIPRPWVGANINVDGGLLLIYRRGDDGRVHKALGRHGVDRKRLGRTPLVLVHIPYGE
jgi:hypothetical protein